eukprot:gene7064-7278_t
MQTLLRHPGHVLAHTHLRSSRKHFIVRASDEKSKVVREFREDTGEITVPGDEKQQQAGNTALYADQVAPAMKKKQDNLSREMKQRLRQEYYGLGGAENQAMGSNYFLWIIAVIAVLAVLSKLTGAI